MAWIVRVVAGLGLVVVGWVMLTALPAVVHGQPAYAVLLVLTALGCGVALGRHRTPRPRHGWRLVGSVVLVLLGVSWIVAIGLLRPFPAQQPALDAMRSGDGVTVSETASRVVLAPAGAAATTALLFQPGARVEARAYAAVLRPLAQAGHRVVIVKQPLGIAFLAISALDAARAQYPDVTSWVVGGHSLGGTVAAIEADAADDAANGPARGLLLYASYPAGDLSSSLTAAVLSVSGSDDGLATPADIEASRADLPASARFEVIDGAVHSYFGDYGPQRGDGIPTITHDRARAEIQARTLPFVAAVARMG